LAAGRANGSRRSLKTVRVSARRDHIQFSAFLRSGARNGAKDDYVFAAVIARHTFSGVSGMSMWTTPRSFNASRTAYHEAPPVTGRPTLMIASKNIDGRPHSELKKIVVTLTAIAAIAQTG